jgi:hypothetical protein
MEFSPKHTPFDVESMSSDEGVSARAQNRGVEPQQEYTARGDSSPTAGAFTTLIPLTAPLAHLEDTPKRARSQSRGPAGKDVIDGHVQR